MIEHTTQPQRKIRKIWMLTREYSGIAGAGGVKDVSRQLAESLAAVDLDVFVFMPRYGFLKPESMGFDRLRLQFEVDMNYANEERREQVAFWHQKMANVEVLLVESRRFEEKLGVYTYTEAEEALDPTHVKGSGHYDYFAMNILLQKAVLGFAMCAQETPDVFHCQDGHTAVLPAMIREIEGLRQFFRPTGCLITIHNAGIGYHQEVADLPFARAITGLPQKVIYGSLLNGAFDPFIAGAAYGSINTVSENYARELQETEMDALTGWLGHALKDRGIHLEGVTNGFNPEDFNPKKPKALGLPIAFDPVKGDLKGKALSREKLSEMIKTGFGPGVKVFGTLGSGAGVPLVTAVSRLSEQKGIDILTLALDALLAEEKNFQVAVLGAGSKIIEKDLIALAENPEYAGRVAILLGYDPKLANLVYAAGDFFVIPSRYEPCGLTDFMAQLMGNLPIVHSVGGLVKVRDGFNGFAYDDNTPEGLAMALRRALQLAAAEPAELQEMRRNAIQNIQQNFTWDNVRNHYLKLYAMARGVQVC